MFAELHCHSNYSFLEGASHPEELVARARDLEMPGLAITDRNGLYGAVKFFGAAQRAGVHPIIGTELTIDDGTAPPKDRVDYDRWGERILLLAENKTGYGNLCRLISMAQMPNAPPERHRLHDVLTAIRHRTTLDAAQRYLPPNAEHYLKPASELRQVFNRYPSEVVDEGLANAGEIAQRCQFR